FARGKPVWKNFTQAYMDLHPHVRRSGPESTQNLLTPAEFKANTSELVQMLKKGHHGVVLDKDSWDILYTWIDLNVPFIGSWKEVRAEIPNNGDVERKKFLAKYANRFDDPDLITWDPGEQKFVPPPAEKKHAQKAPRAAGFPFDEDKAKALVKGSSLPAELVANLGGGVSMRFSLIPAGSFVMGTNDWFYDEGPARVVKIDKPFYMATFETTNAQYAAFDKNHNSGYFDKHWKDHVNRGYHADLADQSVIRVSWKEAEAFCKWLGEKYGLEVSLPTEAQWEWAARAGSDKDFWFGEIGSDFSAYENLADVTTKKFAVMGIDPQPMNNPSPQMAFVPADLQFNDGELVTAAVGSYAPSPFNLYDINGNVAEWTLDDYTKTMGGEPVRGEKVARGGSWRDRSKWARVTLRRSYPDWQKVYNVGFRVVINNPAAAAKKLKVPAPLPPRTPKFSEPAREEKSVDEALFKAENPYDLIINGDFEYPAIQSSTGGCPTRDMPGWSSTSGIELWQGGVMNSPKTDSAGKPATQHLEIGGGGPSPYEVSQSFKIPAGIKNGRAVFSFEAWQRKAKSAKAEVFINGRKAASAPLKGDGSRWTPNKLEVKKLNGGDNVKVRFFEEDSQNEALGWHIDNVKFVIQKK
ncbi:MAG: SUMF1/EgtB/PvdO family nonheme iron enzyme, partial [Opitutales bacterium]|nr:SUMF1/EgtB/PvdO family nonheme iron enzyme [Opitutales bacterium]